MNSSTADNNINMIHSSITSDLMTKNKIDELLLSISNSTSMIKQLNRRLVVSHHSSNMNRRHSLESYLTKNNGERNIHSNMNDNKSKKNRVSRRTTKFS